MLGCREGKVVSVGILICFCLLYDFWIGEEEDVVCVIGIVMENDVYVDIVMSIFKKVYILYVVLVV